MKLDIEENLKSAGIHLHQPPQPGGSYASLNIRGNIAFIAIQFPIKDGEFLYKGRLGDTVTSEQGYSAAQLCAVNILSQINAHIGFQRVVGLNHLDIYFQQSPDWDEAPKVADGASDLFLKVLEQRGLHSRAIMGVQNLPRNFCVGIVSSFTVE